MEVFDKNQPYTNGRIDIISTRDKNENKDLIRKTLTHGTNYNEALTGSWDSTNLSIAFFSSENIRIIQNGIRAGVYERSKGMYNVGYQDDTTLKIIMRSIFLEYAKHIIDKETEEIRSLNKRVLDYCVNCVYNEQKGKVVL